MLPEQVWDDVDMPEHGLYRGKPAGSATPLVWAHAEYLKLLRSARDGKIFDRIDPVYERYCTNNRHLAVRRGVEIFSLRRPVQRVNAGNTLRILDGDRFEIIYSTDGWKTMQTIRSRGLGSAGFSADLNPEPGSGRISWTLHWPEPYPDEGQPAPPRSLPREQHLSSGPPGPGRWLGYNVEVEIVSE
jgi:glucoamylase